MKFESSLVPPTLATQTRRVVIELPEYRAEALAEAINNNIVWSETGVEDELEALYDALYGIA